jgi:tripartite ATP-independent transporter DctM subunit
MVGHFRGGLAQVNVVDSMLFAGISGSAVADVSALGSIIIPQMEKKGYPKPFAAAITAASAIIGPIIPPSGIMIIYAYVMGESVAALFLAGIVPGILIGVALMITIKLMANHYRLPEALPRATVLTPTRRGARARRAAVLGRRRARHRHAHCRHHARCGHASDPDRRRAGACD